ncbi:MAG: hypothetical protein V4651_09820 [Bacteroidota bacterium]
MKPLKLFLFRSKLIRTFCITGFGVMTFALNSCTSYIYSPAIQLSEKQLVKGEVDMKAGFGKLPETKIATPYSRYGGVVNIGYGFSRDINFYASGWSDLTTKTLLYRGGLAVSSRIRLWEKGNTQVLLYPRISILRNNGKSFDAMGFELPLIYITPVSSLVYTYFGVGAAYGNRQLLTDNARRDEELYAVIGHLGMGFKPFDNFRIMLELNPICQFNKYDERTNFILSPTISIGYILNSVANRGKFDDQRFGPK